MGAAGRGWRGIGTTLPWQPLAPGFAPAAPNPSWMKIQKARIFLRDEQQHLSHAGSKERLLLTEVQLFLGANFESHKLSFPLFLLRWFFVDKQESW